MLILHRHIERIPTQGKINSHSCQNLHIHMQPTTGMMLMWTRCVNIQQQQQKKRVHIWNPNFIKRLHQSFRSRCFLYTLSSDLNPNSAAITHDSVPHCGGIESTLLSGWTSNEEMKEERKSCKLNRLLPPAAFFSRWAVGAWLESWSYTRKR